MTLDADLKSTPSARNGVADTTLDHAANHATPIDTTPTRTRNLEDAGIPDYRRGGSASPGHGVADSCGNPVAIVAVCGRSWPLLATNTAAPGHKKTLPEQGFLEVPRTGFEPVLPP